MFVNAEDTGSTGKPNSLQVLEQGMHGGSPIADRTSNSISDALNSRDAPSYNIAITNHIRLPVTLRRRFTVP